jgi:flagellar motility protein MotE (MotC chaperone)
MMLSINENIRKLPKKELKKWIAAREKKQNLSQDWKDELAKLKESMNVKRTGTKSKCD